MKRKIICSIILLSSLFCLAVPCLAYVQSGKFDPTDAYVNCVPFSVEFLRSDNQTLYLYGDDNVLSYDFYIADDSNLDYHENYYSVVSDTPFYFTDYDTDEVISIAQYRYMSNKKSYMLKVHGVPGYYSKLINLMTVPDVFVYTDDSADIYLNVELLEVTTGAKRIISRTYTIYADEFGRAYFSTWNSIFGELGYLGFGSNDLNEPVYVSKFSITTMNYYYGVGTYRWLANMNSYDLPTVAIGGFNDLGDRVTIHDALQSVGIVFKGIHEFMSIEILPFMTFYRLLGMALCVPITIKIIRSV